MQILMSTIELGMCVTEHLLLVARCIMLRSVYRGMLLLLALDIVNVDNSTYAVVNIARQEWNVYALLLISGCYPGAL